MKAGNALILMNYNVSESRQPQIPLTSCSLNASFNYKGVMDEKPFWELGIDIKFYLNDTNTLSLYTVTH